MNSSSHILVFGAGGHGKVVADVAHSIGCTVVAFLDDDEVRDGTTWCNVPVLSAARYLRMRDRYQGLPIALAIGDNAARERCHRRLIEMGAAIATLVHERAYVARSTRLGQGTVMMAGAVANADSVLGEGVIVNTGAVVEHDCIIGDYAHLASNSAMGGSVHIGARSLLGTCASVVHGVRIGADVTVGAGAAVHRHVARGLTVVGVPAHPLADRPRPAA